jgi:UDP-N-acetylglucosamine 2-epimerase (non-hydrolysing)
MLSRGWLRREVFPGGGIVMVHGDTASCWLGMRLARWAGLDVGHVEAGLRSFNWRSPFPEEMIRIRVMRRATLLFPPSDTAARNCRELNPHATIIPTGGNTIVDAMRMALQRPAPVGGLELPDEPFALVVIHRMETITDRSRFARCLALVRRTARRLPVVFVRYPAASTYLRKHRLEGELDDPRIRVIDMLPYQQFIALVDAAELVLADGGSLQEECSYLRKPYLILRNETEREEGLGDNAMLWRFDEAREREFFDRADALAAGDADWPEPTRRILDALEDRNWFQSA